MRVLIRIIRVLKLLSVLSVVSGAITLVFLLQLLFDSDSNIKEKNYGVGSSLVKSRYKIEQRYYSLLKSNSGVSLQNNEDITILSDVKYHSLVNYSLWRPAISESDVETDRIVEQLVWFMTPEIREKIQQSKPKTILLLGFLSEWNLPGADSLQCPGGTHNCRFLENKNSYDFKPERHDGENIDAILLTSWKHDFVKNLPESALKISYFLESPWVPSVRTVQNNTSILASYWRGSDIVTPYAKWVYYNSSVTSKPQEINYAEGKTHKVAIFVSNCLSFNDRLAYVKELSKYIQVDIYGQCGPLKCPKRDDNSCFKKLQKQYKFYLSFENSNCRDYITEKFFFNALQHDIVPIVLGGSISDYTAAAPQRSFIHTDSFNSPKELALYLIYLDETDKLYNEYFQWKGTGEFINTHFLCRVCAMLNYADLEHNPPNKKTDGFPWTFKNKRLCLEGHRWRWTKEDINSKENWDSTLFVNDYLVSNKVAGNALSKMFPVYKKNLTSQLDSKSVSNMLSQIIPPNKDI